MYQNFSANNGLLICLYRSFLLAVRQNMSYFDQMNNLGTPSIGRVLIVEDDSSICRLLEKFLTKHGYETTTFQRGETMFAALDELEIDAAIIDLHLPGISGMEILSELHDERRIPVIVLTGHANIETAVEAMRRGAYDFQTKPIRMEVLHKVVKNAVKFSQTQQENERLRHLVATFRGSSTILGPSQAMQALNRSIKQIAPFNAPVLIRGETGVGKDLVARAIHDASARKDGPYIIANCAAFTESLAESILFGHKRGAFTGAVTDHEGLFVQADKGTLFLDEIGCMPLQIQGKLLRVLEDQTVYPLSSNKPIKIDVRFVSATNAPLETAIDAEEFRGDLYYRLKTVMLNVPPLRERKGDIPLLSAHFLKLAQSQLGTTAHELAPTVLQQLVAYDWPGNVRELKSVMDESAILNEGMMIESLSQALGQSPGRPQHHSNLQSPPLPIPQVTDMETLIDFATQRTTAIEEFERNYLMGLLKFCRGNVSLCCEISGLPYRTLHRKLKTLKIDRKQFTRAAAIKD